MKSFKLIVWGVVGFLVVSLIGLPLFPQAISTESQSVSPLLLTQQPPTHSSSSRVQGLINPQELEAFLDKFFAEQMEELHIPGAVIAVVKDGAVFLTKGYGYADVEKKTSVSSERTWNLNGLYHVR